MDVESYCAVGGLPCYFSSDFYSEQADFQENSPFFIIWPTALKTIKLTSGHTTNVRTQTLRVGGAG